ncbi:unnamed protein product [Nippostrongylus brasiliensis]|uniref:Uncharacterized protein n=1 Tax=Nippostrongylus brasiliensis TaxID=27835 RepID=A0A0N4YEW9_NIPBR|nr:hypothetical protein Q1695_000928 [Nippostrongylus brasiliensis]VDL78867.1 unnamed protein product [Nippostrongylus brasiliensis]
MSDIGKTSGIKIRLPRKKKLPESTKRSAKRNSPREQAEAADQSSEVVDGNDSAPVEDEEQIFRLVEKTYALSLCLV